MNNSKYASGGGGALASKKLLAALAVLAVALVMLAAVPAVDAGTSTTGYEPSDSKSEDSVFSLAVSGSETKYYENSVEAIAKLSDDMCTSNSKVTIAILKDKITPAASITSGPNGTTSNVTIDGNGNTLVKMTTPLVNFKGRSQTTLTIIDLTIDDSKIGAVKTGNTIQAAGAFVAEAFGSVSLNNCHVTGTIIGEGDGHNGVGGFIGYTNQDIEGIISIEDCSITNSTITSNGNTGGFVGLCTQKLEISNSDIADCHIVGGMGGSGWWYSGAVAGLLVGNTDKTFTDVSIENVDIAQGDYKYEFSGEMTEVTFFYGMDVSASGGTTIGGIEITRDTLNGNALAPAYSTKPSFTGTTLTVTDDLEIPNGAVLTIGTGGKIDVKKSGNVDGSGKIVLEGTFFNEGTVTCLVEAEEGSHITNNGTMDNLLADEVYTKSIVEGDVIKDAEYGYEQRVVVTGSAIVKGFLTIHGEIVIEDGGSLTVEPGAEVTIDGARTSVIEGKLVLEGDDDPAQLSIGGSAKVEVSGILSVAGDLTVGSSASIVFKEGATADIGGKLDAKKVVVEDSASLTISGAVVSDTQFEIGGTLIISSDKVSDSFGIVLTADGAQVEIEKVILKGDVVLKDETEVESKGGDAIYSCGLITIEDLGVQIYTEKNDKLEKDVGDSANLVYIAGQFMAKDESEKGAEYDCGAMIKGVTVSASVKETRIVYDSEDARKTTKSAFTGEKYTASEKDKWEHAFTTTVSGSISVSDYFETTSNDATASAEDVKVKAYIDIAGASSAAMGESVLGKNVEVHMAGKVTISGAVTLTSGTSSKYEDAPSISIEKGMEKPSKETSVAAKAPITLGVGSSLTVGGKLTVEAAIDATAYSTADSKGATVVNDGHITMKGAGSIASKIQISKDLTESYDGTAYTVGSIEPVYWYATIDAALSAADNGAKDTIDLYGAQTVLTTATLLADDRLVMNKGATLAVGDKDNTDVVLTIAKDAALKRSTDNTITVVGTLYAEKKTNIENLKTGIESEVYSEQNDEKGKPVPTGWAKWTNLNAALLLAESGQTISLHSDAYIAGTIYEGVTVVAGEFDLVVKQKTTLTVDGVLDVTGTGKLYLEQAVLKDEVNSALGIKTAAGAVVLNGQIRYAGESSIVMGDVVEKKNGAFVIAEDVKAYTIAGAYFVIEVDKADVNTISTPAYAASVLADVEGDVTLKSVKDARDNAIEKNEVGTIDLGAIMFAGKDADNPATVIVECSIAGGVITLSDATLTFNEDVFVDASVSGAAGTVNVYGVVAKDGSLVFTESAFGEDVSDSLFVQGTVKDKDEKTKTSVSFVGTVYVVEDLDVSTDSVTVEGTLVIADGTFTIETDLDVDGTVIIDGSLVEGAEAKIDAKKGLSVVGSLVIQKGDASAETLVVEGSVAVIYGELTVSGDAEVFGSVDATTLNEEGTGYTATFTVEGSLYIGIAAKDVYVAPTESDDTSSSVSTTTGGDVSVTGNVSVKNFAVVAAGAVGPSVFEGEDVLNSTVEYGSTAFMVDGAEYITVFTVTDVSITSFIVEKENANFFPVGTNGVSGWYYIDENGEEQKITSDSDSDKNVGAVESVYAVFDTQIYAVKITADGGVSYITVDGKLMSKDSTGYFYLTNLEAGTHIIAASAASGYDISNIALYVDGGDAVGSMSIDLSGKDSAKVNFGTEGDPAIYYTSSYQLVGSTTAVPSGGSSSGGSDFSGIIDAIDKNTEAVKNQENGGSSDSSLTDILLIVLVVLIVIMAILVAMRMMRS